MAMSQAASWCFTWNNPDLNADDLTVLFQGHPHFRYVIFQREKGENGTVHYQGYVEFKRSVKFGGVKKLLKNAHWEKRMGSRDAARDYCRKEDSREDGPYEAGDFQKGGQGTRSDLQEIAKIAKETGSIRACIEHNPAAFIQYHRGIQALCFYSKPKRMVAPRVILHYGRTGTGKTYNVFSKYPDVYRKAPDTVWFDGYDGQRVLLLDDFVGAASKMSLSYLLQLLDRYPIDVQIKGAYTPLLATTIYITTNLHPRLWYDYQKREEQYKALARRMKEVWWFPVSGDYKSLYVEKDSFFDAWFETCDEAVVFKNVTRPNTPEASMEED